MTCFLYTIIFITLLHAIYTDLSYHIIYDRTQLIGAMASLFLIYFQNFSSEIILFRIIFGICLMLVLWVVGFLFEKFTERPAMGFADIKLLGWLTLLVGENILYVFLSSVIMGVLLSVIRFFIKREKIWDKPFPFAPFVISSFLLLFFINFKICNVSLNLSCPTSLAKQEECLGILTKNEKIPRHSHLRCSLGMTEDLSSIIH